MAMLADFIFVPPFPDEPRFEKFNFSIPSSKVIQICQLIDLVFTILSIPCAFQTFTENHEVRFMFWTCLELAFFFIIRIGLRGKIQRAFPCILTQHAFFVTALSLLCLGPDFIKFLFYFFEIYNIDMEPQGIFLEFWYCSRVKYYYHQFGLHNVFNEKDFTTFMVIFRFFAFIFHVFYDAATEDYTEYLIDKRKSIEEMANEKLQKDGTNSHLKSKEKEEENISGCRCSLDQPCEC